jgi:hypothetical protein
MTAEPHVRSDIISKYYLFRPSPFCPVHLRQALIYLAPFAKTPFDITLTGITNGAEDLTVQNQTDSRILHVSISSSWMQVDTLRMVTLPLLKRFGLEDGLSLKVCFSILCWLTHRTVRNTEKERVRSSSQISKRGAPPLGGGEVTFKCPVVRELKPIKLIEEGTVNRIRGVWCAVCCSAIASACESHRENSVHPHLLFISRTARKRNTVLSLSLFLYVCVCVTEAQLFNAHGADDSEQSHRRGATAARRVHGRRVHLHGPLQGRRFRPVRLPSSILILHSSIFFYLRRCDIRISVLYFESR